MILILRKIIDVIKFSSAYVVALLLRRFSAYRNIWIITERRNECKDNGYYLFKYIREKHPEIKAYYAIDKDSSQKKQIENYGNVLNFNSWRHYLLAILAVRLIGAFIPVGIPDSICFYKFSNLITGKRVYLKHGITKEYLPSHFFDNTGIDCYICGAQPEYNFVLQEFHYPEGNVKYTGFCRFDGLHDIRREQMVLVMPTWRQWIPSLTWGKNEKVNPNQYDFFKMYKQLVTDENMIDILKKNNMRMVVYLHHEIQRYTDYFGKSNEFVTFASEKEYDVQDLLKKCTCLITDYSSVAFDVGYMKKPVIYYQFDEEMYYSKHYQKGYFDYETMGFGKKCVSLKEVQNELAAILDNDGKMLGKYANRVDGFFVLRDSDNTERVFNSINYLE